jgi:hypothetical protein
MEITDALKIARPHVQKAFDTGRWPEKENHGIGDGYHLEIRDESRYLMIDLYDEFGYRTSVFNGKVHRMHHWLKSVPKD